MAEMSWDHNKGAAGQVWGQPGHKLSTVVQPCQPAAAAARQGTPILQGHWFEAHNVSQMIPDWMTNMVKKSCWQGKNLHDSALVCVTHYLLGKVMAETWKCANWASRLSVTLLPSPVSFWVSWEMKMPRCGRATSMPHSCSCCPVSSPSSTTSICTLASQWEWGWRQLLWAWFTGRWVNVYPRSCSR